MNYTPEQLAAILDTHSKWLRGEQGGERACLARANLEGANLEGANLARAYLADANLCGANLRDAIAAHNKYVITASVTNYQMALFQHKSAVLVTAGCHRGWAVEHAREHWSPANQDKWTEKSEAYGKRQLAMLDFLLEQARELGWPVDQTTRGE